MKQSFCFLIAVILSFLASCTDNGQNTIVEKSTNRDDLPIYRLALGDTFVLKIDNAPINHKATRVLGVPPMGHQIGSIKRQESQLSTISLQVDGNDTLFQMPLYKYDSVMFGYLYGRGFLVDTSFDANEWGKD